MAILSSTLFIDTLNYNKHGTAISNTEMVQIYYTIVLIRLVFYLISLLAGTFDFL